MPRPRSERVSADQICSIRFCSATERPKVAISDGRGSAPTTRLRIVRCRAQPMKAAEDDQQREHRPRPEMKGGRQADADQREQDHQVAMGDVDDPHDAEHQRHAEGVLGIEPAQQNPLHQPVKPLHGTPPK